MKRLLALGCRLRPQRRGIALKEMQDLRDYPHKPSIIGGKKKGGGEGDEVQRFVSQL